MDPALRELLREGGADRVIEAIIRFRRPRVELPGVRVVARFGRIATCRLPLAAVGDVRAHPDVVSLKAARPLGPECGSDWRHDDGARALSQRISAPDESDAPEEVAAFHHESPRRPPGLPLTGARVVVGVVDWSLDVDHPNFKRPDGSTRLIALWDQRPARRHGDEWRQAQHPGQGQGPPGPYGYGTVHTRERIDTALRSARPYQALGYHPADADRGGGGAHGTHVMDIAAGNGSRGLTGVAPQADLVFVHLADRDTGGLANLGDSVRLLEAVDFIARTAGDRPWVINLSMGRHGGPHDGTTLTELALDELLSAGNGRFIAQSAGNYHQARTHASGVLRPGESSGLRFVTDPADTTPNELEVWYDGADEFTVRIDPPGTTGAPDVHLGDTADLDVDGQVVGRIYHRAHDPNNGGHHVDAFLYPYAPAGEWRVTLEGRRVSSGRYDAWLERDEACSRCQARFVPADASPACTTGTIANGHLPLVVGAYDAHSPFRPPGRSSSAGPTRDDRSKPDLAAPGVGVLAARSAQRDSERSPGLLVRKTGTSMAAPHVTGAVALCLEAAGHRLGAAEIRRLVLETTDPPVPNPAAPTSPASSRNRLGHGYLNIPALVTAVRQNYPALSEPEVAAMERDDVTPLVLAPARAYRELLYRRAGDFSRWLDDRFTILARPGQQVRDALEVGDVVLRAVLGRPGARGDCAVVAEPGLTRRRTSRLHEPSGWYAVTSGPGSAAGSRVVRVFDPAGCVPAGQLLLRARTSVQRTGSEDWQPQADQMVDDCGCGCGSTQRLGEDDGPSDAGVWTGTAEQEAFRRRVLAEHIARTGRPKAHRSGTCATTSSATCRGPASPRRARSPASGPRQRPPRQPTACSRRPVRTLRRRRKPVPPTRCAPSG